MAMAMAMAAAMEASMESVMEASMKEPAMEMAEPIAEDAASSGEEGRPETPGICPIVLVGIRRDGDHLCRQRVDLER
ncbi:MAG: hypothetical protein J0J01_19430 [Reyranella sp.]|nr:hypothetical protein [Reyranella sp.]